jgi:tetratricopeptide (TPR) repeat protein
VLDSDNVSAKYLEEFDQSGEQASKSWRDKLKKTVDKVESMVPGKTAGAEAPPDHEQLERILVDRAAAQIAARLVNTDEQLDVYLARGKLDDYNKYAESGLWKDWLENLETMKPLPDKEDDAYRLYNIGVAYEAMAYGAEDLKNARKFFDQAAINYGKALEARPAEKYFLEPQNRIRTAIAHYKRLQEHEAVAGKSTRGGEHHEHDGPETVEVAGKGGSAEGPLTNDQVIRLAKAGLDEDNLITTIKTAPAVKFDFGVDALVKLADNGIKGRVLTAMREKASSPPARRRTTPAATKK